MSLIEELRQSYLEAHGFNEAASMEGTSEGVDGNE